MYLKMRIKKSMKDYLNNIKKKIEECDAIVIGAGSGLSTSAGFTYSGDRFNKYFSDFKDKYGFEDMYTGGFYPYSSLEEFWAYWSRNIYINRYMDAPKDTYANLLKLVKDKDYFVLTTNVDHMFQKAGFDKKRLLYTQGDYGLFQCSEPCHNKTYDNKEIIKKMYDLQSNMKIPSGLIPRCPKCGKPMTTNLRCDDSFVQDDGWYKAMERYNNFINSRKNMNIVYLELGVGYNTPGIIKYPFWQLTYKNPKATYICVNQDNERVPEEIKNQSICLKGDIDIVIRELLNYA